MVYSFGFVVFECDGATHGHVWKQRRQWRTRRRGLGVREPSGEVVSLVGGVAGFVPMSGVFRLWHM